MIIRDPKHLIHLNTISRKPLLIMFPFAGGNSYSYKNLLVHLEKTYGILCPELPGRGVLSDQPPLSNMTQLTGHLFETWIKPLDLKRPYILFGHSMGALIAFLMVQQISQKGLTPPVHLVVSGIEGPSKPRENIIYNLPLAEFRNELLKMGGIPEEVFWDLEVMEYLEPILRSDFKAVETYAYIPQPPANLPITVFYGADEGFTSESLSLWEKETKNHVQFMKMSGNHFFILNHTLEIASYLCSLISAKTH